MNAIHRLATSDISDIDVQRFQGVAHNKRNSLISDIAIPKVLCNVDDRILEDRAISMINVLCFQK